MTVPSPTTDHAINIPGFMPFFWLACATLAGILIADLINLPKLVWLILFLLSLLVWLLPLIIKRHWLHPIRNPLIISCLPFIVLLTFFFLGAWIYRSSQSDITPTHPAYYNEKGLVQLTGVIIQPPDVRDTYTNLTIRVDSLTPLASDDPLVDPDTVNGKILLQVLPGRQYHYGDLVSLRGSLTTPPDSGDFSYQDYLARKGIFSLMSYARVEVLDTKAANPILATIYALKERSQSVLTKIFPSPESDLLSGILLGNDNGLSPELKDAYQLTGTTHIIAISGFNIAILAGLITALFNRWLGSRWGTLAAILTISLYTILVGADAAVVRAAIMGGFGMLGMLIGRRGNGLNTLGLSALIMCLLNPNLPWDVGFQLSFMATLGLVIYASPLQSRFEEFLGRFLKEETIKRVAGPISEYILFTLIAQALVLPLLAYHFGRFSLSFLLANPLILPVQPLVMILGGVALLGGLLNPGLGSVLAYLAWPFAAFTNRVVIWLAGLFPNALTLGSFSVVWVFIYYILFFTLTLTK
ncbi:MAG: ComEC family competence protein, partial [Anaerolineaceae bacterium]|nr:ComEC family competence protein [Anaerolineaceae bacterium]